MKKSLLLITTFIIAFCLDIISLPQNIEPYRPFLSLMVLVFWSLMPQSNISIIMAWLLGLCIDAMTGSLIGQHAFSFTLICLIIKLNHKVLHDLVLIQQTILVSGCFLLYALFNFWIEGLQGYSGVSIFAVIVPTIISTLLWPWLYTFLIEVCYISHIKIR